MSDRTPPTPDLTAEIPVLALNGGDHIAQDPDRRGEPVDWEITHREWAGNLAATDRVLLVDYKLGDGTTGRHAFEDVGEMVTVRVPRYPALADPYGAAA